MEFLILVIIAAVVIKLLQRTRRRKKYDQSERFDYFKGGINKKVGQGLYWHKKPLTEIEQIMYWRLLEAIGGEKIVLSQVAFSSFLRTKGDKAERTVMWMKMRQKVADFVICNKDFSVSCIVEIDDKSHKPEKDAARDAAISQAGIKTLRFQAVDLPSIDQIRKVVLNEQHLRVSEISEGTPGSDYR